MSLGTFSDRVQILLLPAFLLLIESTLSAQPVMSPDPYVLKGSIAITGRLLEGAAGVPLGGDRVWVVAVSESPSKSRELVVLGYSHPSSDGSWAIPNLYPGQEFLLAGFSESLLSSLYLAPVRLPYKVGMVPLGNLSTSFSVPVSPGEFSAIINLPGVSKNRNNFELASGILRVVRAHEEMDLSATPVASSDSLLGDVSLDVSSVLVLDGKSRKAEVLEIKRFYVTLVRALARGDKEFIRSMIKPAFHFSSYGMRSDPVLYTEAKDRDWLADMMVKESKEYPDLQSCTFGDTLVEIAFDSERSASLAMWDTRMVKEEPFPGCWSVSVERVSGLWLISSMYNPG